MEKSLWKKIEQRTNIFLKWRNKLLKRIRKKLVELDKETPYLTKEEKLKLLKDKQYKQVKYSPNSLVSSDENRQLIKEHKKYIDKLYTKYDIANKYLENAKEFITRIENKKHISNRNFIKTMQVINWDRFLITCNKNNEIKKAYIHMEVKKINQEMKKSIEKHYPNKRQKNTKIVMRHIDVGVDLWKMGNVLLEGKQEILNKIPWYQDIQFIHSCGRLWDKDFVKFLEKEKPNSRIVSCFKEEKNYSKYLWENLREPKFWEKRMIWEWNMKEIINKYEEKNKNLQEWELLIDIEKMERYLNFSVLWRKKTKENFSIIKNHHSWDELVFRKNMLSFLKTIKNHDPFWIGKIKEIQPFTNWDVAVTFKIKTYNNEIYVCKMQTDDNKLKNEVIASKERSKNWVNTLKSIKDWYINMEGEKKYYTLSPYIENDINFKKLSDEEKHKVYTQIWENMANMHQVHAQGFSKSEYVFPETVKVFDEEIDTKNFLIKNNLMTETEYEEIKYNITNILENLTSQEVLIHRDIKPENFFVMKKESWIEVKIFDTDASIWDPMEDLGLTIIKFNKYRLWDDTIKKQIISSYEKEWWVVDEKKLDIYSILPLFKKAIRHYIIWQDSEDQKKKLERYSHTQEILQYIKEIVKKYKN